MELIRENLNRPVYYVAAIGAGLLLTRVLRILYLLLNVYTIIIVVSLYIFYEVVWKRRLLPNGPIPWLFTGNMPAFIFARSADELFQFWRKKFGGIFTVWIGPIPLVMVCDIQSMKKYFVQNADLFSNRWRNHVTDAFMGGANGVVQIDGPKWREQRRFALHVLRDFGVGKAQMEEKIMNEVHSFISYLRNQKEPLLIHNPIAVCVGNIINNILFGIRYPHGSHEMHHLHSLLDQQSRLVISPFMGLYIAAPFTTYIPLVNTKWCELMKLRSHLWSYLQKHVNEHKANFDNGFREESDFTYSYLCEMEKRRHNGDGMGHFDEWQMTMLLLDLFFAGMETTVTTLKWAFLMAILHPEVQHKVQLELDTYCADEVVSLADKPKLRYTQATVNEIQRIANILPINLLRTVSESTDFDGFHFPKETLVIPQISVLMNDDSIFTDSNEFNPLRFLDSEGNLKRYEEFIPFSIGKRQCLGESLARAELFLIFSNLLKQFTFLPDPNCKMSTQRLLGLTVSPMKYTCIVKPRKHDSNDNII